MRIAIVNDLRLAIEALRRVVVSVPGYEVAWIAINGAEAVERCAQDRPDLVLMDLIMPVMDGVEATRRIMQATPCPILVVTATVAGNAAKVFDAMGHGALDAVCTPVLGPAGRIDGGEALLAKIATLAKLASRPRIAIAPSVAGPAPARGPRRQVVPPLIAIGASTGGPKAIADLVRALPADLPAAIVIVQHVDALFAPGLADWLSSQSPLAARVAAEGDAPEAGTLLVACTNDHMVLDPSLRLHYTPDPIDYPYRPSVDVFFQSAAANWPAVAFAALLTGMGKDGARGLLALRQTGWHTVAQDRESSVVYGMPKAAAEIGAACEILPIAGVPAAITRFVRQHNAANSLRDGVEETQ